MDHAIEGALDRGEVRNKYKLFLLLGEMYESSGNFDRAREHVELALVAWQEWEGSRMPPNLEAAVGRLGVIPQHEISSKEICRSLRQVWLKHKVAHLPKHQGVIKRILPNNKAGFVRSSEGQDYYFKVNSFQGSRKRLQEGLAVDFYLEPSFDRKKDRETEEAVHLKEVVPG